MKPEVYLAQSHGLNRNAIDPDAVKIMFRLARSGYKAYLVGGGVRDLLLRKRPKDYDIATDATPNEIRRLFRNSRVIGRRFKLVHIYFHGNKIIEVSTFRAAADPDSAEGPLLADDNEYGSEVSDAYRRDLTINALFLDIESMSVIDYVGGISDLTAGRIRIIGDPVQRFAEDPVRMMRAVRHAGRSDFELEPSCRRAIKELAPLLNEAPAARLYDELAKDFGSGSAEPIMQLFLETGLAEQLLPRLAEHVAVISRKNSAFRQALARIDDLIVSDGAASTTDVLLLLVVAMLEPTLDLTLLPERLATEDTLSDAIRELFGELPVPRREREKITGELSLFCRVVDAHDRGVLDRKALRPKLPQIERLLEILNPESELLTAIREVVLLPTTVGELEPGPAPGTSGQRRRAPRRRVRRRR